MKAFLVRLFLAVALVASPTYVIAQSADVIDVGVGPGVGSIIDKDDLGNGWYGEPKVKFDEKYLDVIRWMQENGAPESFTFHTAFTTNPDRFAPTQIVWHGEINSGGKRTVLHFAIDAAWTYRAPGVALADVRNAFGSPLEHTVLYPGYGPRNDADPVGGKIAHMIYDVSDKFDAMRWPLGSMYVRLVKINGIEHQEHYERTNRVVTPGTFFSPGKLSPAWLRLR